MTVLGMQDHAGICAARALPEHALREATEEGMGVVRAVLAPSGLRGEEESHAIRT